MTIASVLHTLDIHPVPEPDGKKFDPFNHAIEGINLYVTCLTAAEGAMLTIPLGLLRRSLAS